MFFDIMTKLLYLVARRYLAQKKRAMLEKDPRADVQQKFAIKYISQRLWLQRITMR